MALSKSRFHRPADGLWFLPVKFAAVLLMLTLVAHAGSGDPGGAALDFLEKVRQGKLNLEPGGDTALSPQTADRKKRQISKQLDRLAKDLGNDPLEIGEVRTDENFAGVIIRKVGGFDPGRMQVFPIALVKQGAEWSAAPVPASFENSGASYAVAIRKRLEALENWMLREQVEDLESLRGKSAERTRRMIESSISASQLRSLNMEQAGLRFLEACAERDLPAVLGFLGGLSAEVPSDWPERLKAAEQAMAPHVTPKRPWRLLVSPDVIRIRVDRENEPTGGLVSFAFLDPAGVDSQPPRIEVCQFDLMRDSGGLWYVNPPLNFLRAAAPGNGETDSDLLAKHVEAFPAAWAAAHPLKPTATPEAAWQSSLAGLDAKDLKPLLEISKLDDSSPALAVKIVLQAAGFWSALHDSGAVRQALPVAFKSNENAAVGLVRFFSVRDPDHVDLRTVWFEKTAKGWLATVPPGGSLHGDLKEWALKESTGGAGRWQNLMFAGVPEMKEFSSPTEDEARANMRQWLDSISRGDLKGALSTVALLDGRTGAKLALQNLGYEIGGARKWRGTPAILSVHSGKLCSAVAVKITGEDGKDSYPLYPVVKTEAGSRILAEVDLSASENRSRDFLNNTSLGRVTSAGFEAVASELKQMLADHQEAVREARKMDSN